MGFMDQLMNVVLVLVWTISSANWVYRVCKIVMWMVVTEPETEVEAERRRRRIELEYTRSLRQEKEKRLRLCAKGA